MRYWLIAIVVALGLALPAKADWQQIPGTNLSAAQPNNANLFSFWAALSFERETGTLCDWKGGGHADYGGGDSYCLKLGLEVGTATPWLQVEPVQPLTGPLDLSGGCPRPPYGPGAGHTYDAALSTIPGRFLWGTPTEYCATRDMNTGDSVWTVEYTFGGAAPIWTEVTNPTNVAVFGRFGRSAFKDGKVYTVGDRAGILDADGQVLFSDTVQFRGVILNGVTQPFTSGFRTGLSTAGINDANQFCLGGDTGPSGGPYDYYLQCSQIDGVREGCLSPTHNTAPTCNDRSFPRFIRRPFFTSAPAGSCMAQIDFLQFTVAPAGLDLYISDGGKKLFRFRPHATDPALDECENLTAAVGPTSGTMGHISENLFFYPPWNALVLASNRDESIWYYPLGAPPSPPNQAPVANDDAFVGAEDTVLAGNVLANDTDDNGPLTAAPGLLPEHGDLTLNPDGSFIYTPAPDYFGQDSFTYVVSDGELSDTGTVTLTVTDVAEPPPPPPPPAPNKLTCEVEYQGDLPDTFTMNCERTAEVVVPPPPPPPPPPEEDGAYGPPPGTSLAELCARQGTLLCDPLDDTTPISGPGWDAATSLRYLSDTLTVGYSQAPARWMWLTSSTVTRPSVDPAMGNGGAIKFTINSQSGAGGASQYTVNLAKDHSIAIVQGETMRIRFKVRWSCDVLFVDCDPQSPTYKQERRRYAVTQGEGGIKIFSVGEADTNTAFFDGGAGIKTPVFGNFKQYGYIAGYIAGVYVNLANKGPIISGITTYDNQPGGPTTCWQNDMDLTPDPFPTVPKGFGLPFPLHDAGCHMMQADQWVTIQMDLHHGGCQPTPGTNDPLNSHVKLWIADEGQPFDLVIDKPTFLACSSLGSQRIGKVWITPYNTDQDPAAVHPTGYVWYDDIWVQKVQ